MIKHCCSGNLARNADQYLLLENINLNSFGYCAVSLRFEFVANAFLGNKMHIV